MHDVYANIEPDKIGEVTLIPFFRFITGDGQTLLHAGSRTQPDSEPGRTRRRAFGCRIPTRHGSLPKHQTQNEILLGVREEDTRPFSYSHFVQCARERRPSSFLLPGFQLHLPCGQFRSSHMTERWGQYGTNSILAAYFSAQARAPRRLRWQ